MRGIPVEDVDGINHVLTLKGIRELRTAIRAELKARSERFLI
jgi:hypothetical protein